MRKWGIYALAILLCVAISTCRQKQPKEIRLSLMLNEEELLELEKLIKRNEFLSAYKFKIEPNLSLSPEFLLLGKDQPDIFELNFQDLPKLVPHSLGMKNLISGDYEQSIFFLSYFQPGKFQGDYYYVPFKLSWLAFFYNHQRVFAEINNLTELSSLCYSNPGTMGLALADDEQIVQFINSLIWAFDGDEFDLNQEGTKKALYLLSSFRECLSPFSWHYDTAGLAEALGRGEIDFAFANFSVAKKLWEDNLYPYPIIGQKFPSDKPIAFTGNYLAINKSTTQPKTAYLFLFYLSNPSTCVQAMEQGLWLCGMPTTAKLQPELGKEELFAPFLATVAKLKPASSELEFTKLAELYRELVKRIVLAQEQVELVASDLRLPLQKLKPARK